ncbi:MAG TPA: hypothetical protein VL361_06525 [Candidatus Limnocylindrales bacterium]|nr:hypothetical protein [Candidatus Limnocylindrales bacterium]
MKCLAHSAEAVGLCAYCGRALCAKCVETQPDAQDTPSLPQGSVSVRKIRLSCSQECALALENTDAALRQLVRQGFQNARASAFYCYLCAGLSAAAAIVAYFMLPSTFLILFTGGCAVALSLSGFWYGRSARRGR